MSKVVLVKSKCPECGARLKIDPQAEYARCEYCGTTARIADKKKPQPQTPAAPKAPEPVIWVSPAQNSARWTWIIGTVMPLVIFGVVFYTVTQRTPLGNMLGIGDDSGSGPGSGGSVGQSFGDHMQWVGHKQPMLADVTGDGVMDVLGWVRFINMTGGKVHYEHLAAFDPTENRKIWDTGPVSDSQNTQQTRAAIVGDKLLLANAAGVLQAFSLRDGTPAWQAVIGEQVTELCGAENGGAEIHTRDGRTLRVNLATGEISPAGDIGNKSGCIPVQTDNTKVGPYFIEESARGIAGNRVAGMRIERLVTDTSTGKVTAVGFQKPGPRTPMAAGVEIVQKKKKRTITALWRSSITSLNPQSVEEGAPKAVGAAQGKTLFAYSKAGRKAGARLSCLDQSTGVVLWDVPIPRSDTGNIDGLTVSDHHVFVSHWTYLDIFQLADGEHKMTVGIW